MGGKVNILRGDSIGHCEKNKVYMNLCLIMTNYLDRPSWICRSLPFPLNFCLWGWIQIEVDIINIDTPHELQSALRLTAGFSNIYCEINKFDIFVMNFTLKH